MKSKFVFASLLFVLLQPASVYAQYTRLSGNSAKILEGNWQSCQEPGGYSERIYDHVVNGIGLFEVHLGPNNEFAVFKGVQDEHRNHNSKDNMLRPYTVPIVANRAKANWEIPSLNLFLSVELAGGSRLDCTSWFITLEPLRPTSH